MAAGVRCAASSVRCSHIASALCVCSDIGHDGSAVLVALTPLSPFHSPHLKAQQADRRCAVFTFCRPMGRSAKITRCVGLRQMKNLQKNGVAQQTTTKARRRKEKAEKIKAAMEQEADARREKRAGALAERKDTDARASVRTQSKRCTRQPLLQLHNSPATVFTRPLLARLQAGIVPNTKGFFSLAAASMAVAD